MKEAKKMTANAAKLTKKELESSIQIQKTGNITVPKPEKVSRMSGTLSFNQKTIGTLVPGTNEYLASDLNIYVTNDYGIFKAIQGNRMVSDRHVEEIMELFGKEDKKNKKIAGWNYKKDPIIVNEKMEVIDGQHRLEACKRMNLPVYYYKQAGWGIPEVNMKNNTGKPWNNEDFLNSYQQIGREDYVELKKMYDNYTTEKKLNNGNIVIEHIFPLQIFISIFDNDRNPNHRPKRFKDGEYRYCKNEYDIREGKKALDSFMELSNIFPKFYNNLRFMEAVMTVARGCIYYSNKNEEAKWDWDRFVKQCRNNCDRIHKASERNGYIDQIIDVYNYKLSKGNRISLENTRRYGKYSNKPF